MKRLLLALPLLLLCASAYGACTGSAPTWTSTPDAASVQTCINSAIAGDTINVSAGSVSWGTGALVTLNKAITLNGAGIGVTNINMTAHPSFTITKQASGIIRIQNMSFSGVGPETVPHFVTVNGPWPTGDPVIFQNIGVNVQGASMFDVFVAGGVIFSHIAFVGTWDNAMVTVKDLTHTSSWTTADTLGTNDTTGKLNVYVEDSTFIGGANGVVDCDDNCRIVWRHNTHGFNGQDGGGFNSHGKDSSPYGMREFEIYNNSFTFPDTTCLLGNSSLSNINKWNWIRGGSGVMFNNAIAHLTSSCWGVKTEIRLSNRGAEDDRWPQGISCGALTYPASHQLGQNNNGSADFTDPIWFWGNTGTIISLSGGWDWGNPCGFDWNTYWQWGRDGQQTSLTLPITLPSGGGSVTGIGGTAKPGYTPYTYPHPLVSSSTPVPVIVFSPNPVPFGTINVGSSSSPVTTNASNVGGATETYTSLASSNGQFVRSGGTCTVPSGTIVAGAGCTWIGIFTPTAQGPQSASLTITGTVTSSVQLTGSGQTTVSIPSTPTGLGAVASGTTVNLSWTASTGTITGYKVSRGTVSGGPYTLIATTSTTATTYSDLGLANGTYYYVVSAYNSAGTSANSSQASAVVSIAPAANLTPSSINFGNVVVGSNSNTQQITLTNTGTATLSSIVVNDPSLPDFSQTNTCGASLAINANCVVTSVFSPTSANAEQATLTITSNTGPATAVLNGVGQPVVVITPPSVTLTATYTTKTSATSVLTYSNPNGPTITVASIAFSGGDASVFSQTNNCVGTVVNGAFCTINITFTPTSNGNKTTTLIITDSANGSPRSIVVSGQAKGHHILKIGVAI